MTPSLNAPQRNSFSHLPEWTMRRPAATGQSETVQIAAETRRGVLSEDAIVQVIDAAL